MVQTGGGGGHSHTAWFPAVVAFPASFGLLSMKQSLLCVNPRPLFGLERALSLLSASHSLGLAGSRLSSQVPSVLWTMGTAPCGSPGLQVSLLQTLLHPAVEGSLANATHILPSPA